MSTLNSDLVDIVFENLGEPDYSLPRMIHGAEPFHYWCRESIEAAIRMAIGMNDEFPPLPSGTLRELSHSPSIAMARQIKSMALECIAFRATVEAVIDDLVYAGHGKEHILGCDLCDVVKTLRGAMDHITHASKEPGP